MTRRYRRRGFNDDAPGRYRWRGLWGAPRRYRSRGPPYINSLGFCLDCGDWVFWRCRRHVQFATWGPRMGSMCGSAGFACGAYAEHHQACSVARACQAAREPQGLCHHWGCGGHRHWWVGRPRRGRRRGHCGIALASSTRGGRGGVLRARLRGHCGRLWTVPGRLCDDLHTLRSVEAVDRHSVPQGRRQRMLCSAARPFRG